MIRAFLLAALLSAAGSGQGPEEIDFEALGRDFIEERCGEGAGVSDCGLERVLAERFARVRLGAFELRYPAAFLDDKERCEDFGRIALSLVDCQRLWIEWLTTGTEHGSAGLGDLALVREWVDGWSVKRLASLAKKQPETLDLLELFEASADVRAAEERLHAFLEDPRKLGLALMPDQTVRIALSPTRLDFMRWVGYAGLLEPDQRTGLWVDGVDQWTQFWCGWTLVAALEYAPWNGFDPKFRTGMSMKTFDETGLVEQVCLQACMALLRSCLSRDVGHAEHGIAMNLVIELVGQLDTIDEEGQIETTGGRTQPYSRFVPGGSSQGGTLPPISAQSRNAVKEIPWREGKGRDFFLAALRKGQKAGHKAAAKDKQEGWRDERAHFLLQSDAKKHVVSAPFFGKQADDQDYPPFELLNDYRHFFRAYKCAFFHWLRTSGEPQSEEASLTKFRDFMRGLEDVSYEEDPLESLCQRVYGLPLSAGDGEVDSLEWRFLEFLERGK